MKNRTTSTKIKTGMNLFCVFYIAFVFLSVCVQVYASESQTVLSAKGKKYTAQNLWYENPASLWCINYQKGDMIPAGTEVRDVQLTRAVAGRKSGADKLSFSFITVKDNRKYWVNIKRKFHPGKTIHDYMKTTFTKRNFDEITIGMTEKEIDAIKQGVVVKGMSKKAVLISYGIPPEHRTPSLESNIWFYWKNIFRSKAIHFDKNNRAIPPPVKKSDPDIL